MPANATADSNVTPQLRLVGPAGDLLAQVDNPSADRNILIRSFSAPQAGTDFLQVSTAMGGMGDYTVHVGRLSATVAVVEPPAVTLPAATQTLPPTPAPVPTATATLPVSMGALLQIG